MSDVQFVKYSATNEARIYKKPKIEGDRQRPINQVLHGTWLGVLDVAQDWYFVRTAGEDGWIHKDDTSDHMGLKVFFVDVGQGDAVLIEVGDIRILVDGGPNSHFKNYLTKWQFSYVIAKNEPIHIDYVFISHFDADHYEGLIDIFSDTRFTFGTVYHNGIARFIDNKTLRPAEYNTHIGIKVKSGGKLYLTTMFDSIDELKALREKGGFSETFNNFAMAIINAHTDGRIQNFNRASHTTTDIVLTTEPLPFTIEFLGPVPIPVDGTLAYRWFGDEAPTINGHSLVLKVTYGQSRMLLGGDLNSRAEDWLMDHYGGNNPFEVEVAKSCHHGSSDFEVEFMKRVSPFATVISSGDNESHAHPRADAIGCAGRYSRGIRPKVFSTELARSINSSGDILFGMINMRSNGTDIYMSQMKEAAGGADIWDSYTVIE